SESMKQIEQGGVVRAEIAQAVRAGAELGDFEAQASEVGRNGCAWMSCIEGYSDGDFVCVCAESRTGGQAAREKRRDRQSVFRQQSQKPPPPSPLPLGGGEGENPGRAATLRLPRRGGEGWGEGEFVSAIQQKSQTMTLCAVHSHTCSIFWYIMIHR